MRPLRASGRAVGLNRSGVTLKRSGISNPGALNIFPAALQNELFVKSKLREKYQKPRIPTKENL
jgi:hypothetical protein